MEEEEEKEGRRKKKMKKSQNTDESKADKTKCPYCGNLGHRKSECQKLAADEDKSTSEGKLQNIIELGAAGSVFHQLHHRFLFPIFAHSV